MDFLQHFKQGDHSLHSLLDSSRGILRNVTVLSDTQCHPNQKSRLSQHISLLHSKGHLPAQPFQFQERERLE